MKTRTAPAAIKVSAAVVTAFLIVLSHSGTVFANPILLTDSVVDKPKRFSITWRQASPGTSEYDGNYWKLDFTTVDRLKSLDVFSLSNGQHKKPVLGHEAQDNGASEVFATSLKEFAENDPDNEFLARSFRRKHGIHKDFWAVSQGLTAIEGKNVMARTITVEAVHGVPEPSSLIFFSAGLGLVLIAFRKKRMQ